MPSFADLGIPFPLFEAPTTETGDYAGLATCRLCGHPDRHCFEVDDLILPCPTCGVENGLPTAGRIDTACRGCGSTIPFPEPLRAKKQILVCHGCLRAGKAAMTKDTEFGMVSWEQAIAGITHGVPSPRTDEFEIVPIDPCEDWYGARVPSKDLWELLRTPNFISWQGEIWLFCCQRPMSYLGNWREAVALLRPEDPGAFFASLFNADDEAREQGFEWFEGGSPCLYVHRCRSCGRCRATHDSD